MAAGDLDTSFSGDGRRTIDFGGADEARVVLVQPNGRIVVAGGGRGDVDNSRFCVARLRADGTFDTAFGSGGKRVIEFGGDQEAFFGGALQPDGKIVLVGDSDFRVAVARLNPNGSFDTTFTGDGKKIFSWGRISRATAAIVLPSGKLLLAGFSGPEGGNFQAARLNPNGALDPTFGTGGKAAVDFGGDDFGQAVARQADGRILVAGRSTAAGAVVARLRTNGALDASFGGDGRVTLGPGSARAVLVQPDGRIVVAGNLAGNAAMRVARLLPSGAPDTTFGGDGTAELEFGSGSAIVGGAALQTDGKVVVAGSAGGGKFAAGRLNADGSPDAGFGAGGEATAGFATVAFGFAVALQANGRIVVAGQRTETDDFAVARLLA